MSAGAPQKTGSEKAKPVNIVPFSTLDLGIEFRFRGIERDRNGEPIGEMVDMELIVPPLNLYNLKRLEKHFKALSTAGADIAAMHDLIELLLAALSQNYTGVPRWLVEQSMNPGNFPDMAVSLMDVSGLKRKEIEEKKAKAGTPPPSTPPASSTE
jgi:hypothetical protein